MGASAARRAHGCMWRHVNTGNGLFVALERMSCASVLLGSRSSGTFVSPSLAPDLSWSQPSVFGVEGTNPEKYSIVTFKMYEYKGTNFQEFQHQRGTCRFEPALRAARQSVGDQHLSGEVPFCPLTLGGSSLASSWLREIQAKMATHEAVTIAKWVSQRAGSGSFRHPPKICRRDLQNSRSGYEQCLVDTPPMSANCIARPG